MQIHEFCSNNNYKFCMIIETPSTPLLAGLERRRVETPQLGVIRGKNEVKIKSVNIPVINHLRKIIINVNISLNKFYFIIYNYNICLHYSIKYNYIIII